MTADPQQAVGSGRVAVGRGAWLIAVLVTGLAGTIALAISGPTTAAWVTAVTAVVVLVLFSRMLILWAGHPDLRRARRQLIAQAGGNAIELCNMAGPTAEALEGLAADCCGEADIKDAALYIQIDDGDPMAPRLAGLGFESVTSVDMPWGRVHLLLRPRLTSRQGRQTTSR